MRPAVFGIGYYICLSRRGALKGALYAAVGLTLVGCLPLGHDVRLAAFTYALVAALFWCAILSLLFDYEMSPDRMGFPRSLFTLPVATRTLVFWPWLFGITSSAMWWVVSGTLLNWLYGSNQSVVVPALGLAVWIAWLQVGLWAPVRTPLVKFPLFLSGIPLPGMFVAWLYVRSGLPEYAMVLVLVVCLALLYLAGLAGVAYDRRGDAWLSSLSTLWRLWQNRRQPAPLPPPFASPARAQRWFNWRSPEGLGRTFMAAPLAALFGLLFFFSRTAAPKWNPHLVVFLGAVVLPTCIAPPMWFLATKMSLSRGSKPVGLRESMYLPLLRPIGTGSLGVSFLRSLLRCAIWSWAFWLALALLVCLCWNAFSATPAGMAHDLKVFFGGLSWWQCSVVVAFTFGAVVGLTWRLVADLLLLAMFGYRRYADTVAAFLAVVGLNGLVAIGVSLLLEPATRPWAVDALAVAGVVILAVKLMVAGLAFRSVYRNGQLEGLSLRRFFAVWLVLAAILLGTTAGLVSSFGLPVPTSFVLLWVVILLPLGRFALLSLGFEALRHR
jgi:hypothetical protein